MFLVHLFLLLFMWWWWGIVSPPAVSPAGTEQSYLTLPQEYFQQHFKSIINFIFIKSIIEDKSLLMRLFREWQDSTVLMWIRCTQPELQMLLQ